MKYKGWLDPWGRQHEQLCGYRVDDWVPSGSCDCDLLQAHRRQLIKELRDDMCYETDDACPGANVSSHCRSLTLAIKVLEANA